MMNRQIIATIPYKFVKELDEALEDGWSINYSLPFDQSLTAWSMWVSKGASNIEVVDNPRKRTTKEVK